MFFKTFTITFNNNINNINIILIFALHTNPGLNWKILTRIKVVGRWNSH